MVRIVFKDLKIDEISNASGVFTGHNFQYRWHSSQKSNEGHGDYTGDRNIAQQNRSTVIDSDVVDQWIRKPHVPK